MSPFQAHPGQEESWAGEGEAGENRLGESGVGARRGKLVEGTQRKGCRWKTTRIKGEPERRAEKMTVGRGEQGWGGDTWRLGSWASPLLPKPPT